MKKAYLKQNVATILKVLLFDINTEFFKIDLYFLLIKK